MFAWIVIILLGVFAVGSLLPRQHPQNHPKAGELYCYPVFALLSGVLAIFLVITQFAHVSFLASLIFWVTWGLCLTAVALFTRKDGFWGTLFATVAALAIVLSPIGLTTSNSNPSASQNIGGDQAQSQASPGTGTAPATCDPAYVQKWENNPDYRVVDGGLYKDVTHHTITPAQADTKQREVAGHDVRALAGYAFSEGLRSDATYTNLLTPDKKCLSTQGIALYKALTSKWDKSHTSIAPAPANATNSGMENSSLVVNATSGITGDRTALKRSYAGGSPTYALARCGNPVFPGKPTKVPPGHTDQHPSAPPSTPTTTPPTTKPPTTPPPTTTTPPTTPPTTETTPPKGPGPVPSGVPTFPTHSQPPETTPPVETHPANPSTTPGSEPTGVTAPGASQGPTTPVTQPPVTGAPSSTDPGTGIQDPDSGGGHNGGNTALGALALPFLGLGLRIRRNRI